ncbi:cilia- and flagella-associated protein 206 [Cynoglossus semilaevis]|uniref:cilia- and flagella-associated protein 206 n=1 Tax=Cynoglossus semilaevis TaxID=244447 RepID=UPI000D6241F6|nr:cilia- and flagella-associated protein 206 [Cynoglossus semilaevis]
MSRPHAESVIKSIIAEIIEDCAVRGHGVSDTLAAFMVKAVVLDPRNGFHVDRTLTKEDIKKLEEICLNKLTENCSPSFDTVKMQVYFEMNFSSRREFLEDVHRGLESRLRPVVAEITESRVRTRDQLDSLYRRIVSYIVLRSGMGSPADVHTVKEATAALHSVFPPTELGAFMVLLKNDKEQQLDELVTIVTGIRLFNKACRTGVEQSDLRELMPDVLNQVLPVVSRNTEQQLSLSQSLAWRYTAVLEKMSDPDHTPDPDHPPDPDHTPDLDHPSDPDPDPDHPSDPDRPPVHLLKEALYNVRQQEAFLRLLLAETRVCTKHVELLQRALLSQIKLMKETVASKTAVPTTKVFPLFKALSKVWSELQDEAELLNILGDIALNLQPFLSSQAQVFSEEYLGDLLGGCEVKTDEQRLTETSGESLDWLQPETAGFSEMLLQYNGFCGSTFVSKDGLLLPGNPHIGLLKHREKLYAFSSREAALTFASCPDKFISEVLERAKLSPELLQLLRLQQHVSGVSAGSELLLGESALVKPVTKCEGGTQTDLHPVESNIVTSYEWNEWELRRKALKLADLRSKVTHSTQTHLSHMRRENASQTWPLKEASCQSKRDGGSSVPKPQTYLTGLRGQRVGHVVKTDLTRPAHD